MEQDLTVSLIPAARRYQDQGLTVGVVSAARRYQDQEATNFWLYKRTGDTHYRVHHDGLVKTLVILKTLVALKTLVKTFVALKTW